MIARLVKWLVAFFAYRSGASAGMAQQKAADATANSEHEVRLETDLRAADVASAPDATTGRLRDGSF